MPTTVQQQDAINNLRGFSASSSSYVYSDVPAQEILPATYDVYFSSQTIRPNLPTQNISSKIWVCADTFAPVNVNIEFATGLQTTITLMPGVYPIQAVKILSAGTTASKVFWSY